MYLHLHLYNSNERFVASPGVTLPGGVDPLYSLLSSSLCILLALCTPNTSWVPANRKLAARGVTLRHLR
jgi:hypothetical protein